MTKEEIVRQALEPYKDRAGYDHEGAVKHFTNAKNMGFKTFDASEQYGVSAGMFKTVKTALDAVKVDMRSIVKSNYKTAGQAQVDRIKVHLKQKWL